MLVGLMLSAGVSRVAAQAQAPKELDAKPQAGGDTEPQAAGEAAPAQAPLMDWSHTRSAYRLCQQWVAAGSAEAAKPGEPLQAIWVSGATGVHVTLRWLGLTMGSGVATAPVSQLPGVAPAAGQDPSRHVLNLADLTQQATQRALLEVEQRLRDQAAQSQRPISPERLYTLATLGPKLLVDVQFAQGFEPIRIRPDDDVSAILLAFAPGYHGLCMGRQGQDRIVTAWIWPATALAANASPSTQVGLLLRRLELDQAEMVRLGRPGAEGMPVARFGVIHMVQPTADLPMMQLQRGQVMVPAAPITAPTLNALADRTAERLRSNQLEQGQLAGTFEPTADRWNPRSAPLEELGLAIYAMSRRAEVLAQVNPEAVEALNAEQFVRKAMNYLLRETVNLPAGPLEPNTLAMMLMTICDSPQLGDYAARRDAIAKRLLTVLNEDGSFREDLGLDGSVIEGAPGNEKEPTEGLDPLKGKQAADKAAPAGDEAEVRRLTFNLSSKALILCALSSLYEQTRNEALRVRIDKARDTLWQDPRLPRQVTTMPWLAMLELRMHRLAGADDAAAQAAWQQRSVALHALAMALREAQVATPPALGPADVVGGFVLSPQPADGAPSPDWLTAHVMAYLAIAMRHDELTRDQNTIKWLLDCGLAGRFLVQLVMEEPNCFYAHSPADAVGGVRFSLWDNRIAVAPTAMTLLAATELQATLAQTQPSAPPAP